MGWIIMGRDKISCVLTVLVFWVYLHIKMGVQKCNQIKNIQRTTKKTMKQLEARNHTSSVTGASWKFKFLLGKRELGMKFVRNWTLYDVKHAKKSKFKETLLVRCFFIA